MHCGFVNPEPGEMEVVAHMKFIPIPESILNLTKEDLIPRNLSMLGKI